ncbi:hypothetical protein [uncultured Cyclobacterium sp.]|uniref:hypothetical protein n=1 Tax=uncultured Cyclobacterium sp. TaxID=453820 RepID=UPI0030EC7592|tara:strand:- start:24187 stop:24783 length:597 start_codon:yes stop_codon:yes gene_type:complete
MNKRLLSLFLIYIFQFLATSCVSFFCDCDRAITYERTYKGFELNAFFTSDFQNTELSNTDNKNNSFGLMVFVEDELNQITYLKSKLDFSSFGFTSAYACSCAFDQYINVDPIEYIEIGVTDSQSQEITNVTANFTIFDLNGKQTTISKLFENRIYQHDKFQLIMMEYDNIPDSSIFTVKIVLESGTELIQQTQEINFK